MADLRVNVCGVELKNPVTTASGTFGFGHEYADFYDLGTLGGVGAKGLTPEEQKKDKSTMPGMSENPFDKVYLVTPQGTDTALTERLTEKAKYHFDAELCVTLAEAVRLAHANTRRGLLVCGSEAAALEAAELLANS